MACPFAQLSPLLLLSLLVLFLQYGASFFSPKPLLASLHRGRSISGTSRKTDPSRSPHHGRRGGSREGGENANGGGAGGPRMMGIAGDVLTAYGDETETEQGEDLLGDPLPWKESLSTGEPLFYSNVLRHQAIALQLGLGLDRVACPRGVSSVCNSEKKARVRNVVYAGDRVRKLRLSYLDTPGMQVFSSVAYGAGGYDFPLLGVSAMAMGRIRVLAMDLQPLFQGPEYAAKYSRYYERLAAVRRKHPELGQEMQKDYYKGSPFFSDTMLYVRWGLEEEASGFMQRVIMPAIRECVEAYIDLVNDSPPSKHAPGSAAERAILDRQSEFDRFHAAREQVRPVMTANFGSTWADQYVNDFLFSYGSGGR